MRQADFARPGNPGAAPDQPGIRHRMMGRPERPLRQQSGSLGQQACNAMNLRGFERFGEGQRRQDSRKPLGQHGLARARRTHQQHVMTPGCGDFQRPFRRGLAANVLKIENVAGRFCLPRDFADLRLEKIGLFQERDRFGQVAHSKYRYPVGHRCFGGIIGRNQQVADAPLLGARRDRKRAAHRTHGSIER